MRRHFKIALAAGALFAPVACKTTSAVSTNPPDWPAQVDGVTPEELSQGLGLVQNNCSSCHSREMLQQQRLTKTQWEGVVKKMRKWGSPLEDEQEALLVATLSKMFGPGAPAYELSQVSPEEAEAAIMPLPDGAFAKGNASRGDALFGQSCGPCHGPQGRGGTIGVNLLDKPRLYRASEWAQIVRTGRGRMPGFEDLTDPQLADVIAFLREQSAPPKTP